MTEKEFKIDGISIVKSPHYGAFACHGAKDAKKALDICKQMLVEIGFIENAHKIVCAVGKTIEAELTEMKSWLNPEVDPPPNDGTHILIRLKEFDEPIEVWCEQGNKHNRWVWEGGYGSYCDVSISAWRPIPEIALKSKRVETLEAELAEFKSWQPMNTIPNDGTPIEILDTYNGKVYSVTKGRTTTGGVWGYSCFLDKWGAERTGNWRPRDWGERIGKG